MTTPDPLETVEFGRLAHEFHSAEFDARGPRFAAIKAYLRPFLKPPGPPVSETPPPREVRREFRDYDGYPVEVTVDAMQALTIHRMGTRAVLPVQDAQKLARLILEVHAEATRPDPPKCPYCGGEVGVIRDCDDGTWQAACSRCRERGRDERTDTGHCHGEPTLAV